MTADPIIDPRTGCQTTVYRLARETGVAAHIIWHRYDTLGIRSMTLLAPKGVAIDIDAERQLARRIWRTSSVGRLTTAPRLGDYARLRQQQSRGAA